MSEEVLVPVTVANLLGTPDEHEQVRAVEKLISAAKAPIVTMTTVLDTRTGSIDLLLNGQYSFEEIYTLLDMIRREVLRREREAVINQA